MADFITQFPENEVVSRENFNSRIAEANTALTTVQDAAAVAQTTANTALSNTEALNTGKLDTGGNGSNLTAVFSQAGTRANIVSGEKLSVIFGKIMKWFADLGAAAWMGTGTTASTVALGNHTHTAAAVGAVPTTRKVNGKALSADVTLTASDVGARAEDWLPTPEQIFASRALQSDVTLYVSPSGSDSTGDGTSGKPYKTITKALSVIPKNLNGYEANINIAAGTYIENVTIRGYVGGLLLIGSSVNDITINGNIYVRESRSVKFLIDKLNGSLNIDCGIAGIYKDITISNPSSTGISVYSSSKLYCDDVTVTINNCTLAVNVQHSSEVSFFNIAGTGNTSGFNVRRGGKLTYNSEPSNTLSATTAQTIASGGRIYAGGQTSAPNY